jgi:hypothetical protein
MSVYPLAGDIKYDHLIKEVSTISLHYKKAIFSFVIDE